MKRTYISPEFDYKPIFGSFNMQESSSFFGSKMMEIEDKVDIKNDNLIYHQLLTGEQIDESSELNLPQIIYDATLNKEFNHTIELDPNQSDFDKENSAQWKIRIEMKDILRNHIFAILKNKRTFEGLKNEMVISGGVDYATLDYINKNIISRYGLKSIDFFVEYLDLCGDGTLQYKNVYDKLIESTTTKTTKSEIFNISVDQTYLDVRFRQEKPAYAWSFKYYFNIYFEKL